MEFLNVSKTSIKPSDSELFVEKSQRCQKCMKSFPTSQQLLQHSLVHSNLRKFSCAYCDKSFKQLSHLQQHQRIHTGKLYFFSLELCQVKWSRCVTSGLHRCLMFVWFSIGYRSREMKNIVNVLWIHSRWKTLSMYHRGLYKGVPTTIKPSAAP